MYIYFENYMIAQVILFPWSLLCVAAWAVVALGTTWAVFSPKIRDTVLERIALSIISVAACSRAYYIWETKAVSIDGTVVALALGFYVLVLYWKHCFVIPRMRSWPKRGNDFVDHKR